MNVKTGQLACSSRNLYWWVLLCKFEMTRSQAASPKMKGRSRRKNGGKCNKSGKDGMKKAFKCQIDSVFSTDCQGTGVNIDGDDWERPTMPLPEMFKYKIKLSDGHRAWMGNPEVSENCSTGFLLALQSEETVEEKVVALKKLHFYRVDE